MRAAKRKADEIERLKRDGFRDRRLLEYTFENDKGYNPEIARAKRYVELFPDMEARGMGLLLWGYVGTGKTYQNYEAALRSWARRSKDSCAAVSYEYKEGESL